MDLSGPKIRVGELTAPIELERRKMVVLAPEQQSEARRDSQHVPFTAGHPFRESGSTNTMRLEHL